MSYYGESTFMELMKQFDQILKSFSQLTLPFVALPEHVDIFNDAYWRNGLENDNVELSENYSLNNILFSKKWIELTTDLQLWDKYDRGKISPCRHETKIGAAFGYKYDQIESNEDARFVAKDWCAEALSIFQELPPSSKHGSLLHIGSDNRFEPSVFHKTPKKIYLIDVSRALLTNHLHITPKADRVIADAANLIGVPDNSIDLYVALRVYSSFGFLPTAAITEAARVLKHGGHILISESNGYRAYDNTIIPGQIHGSPPKLSFSRPFRRITTYLSLLANLGFIELEVHFGSAEIYISGVYQEGHHTSSAKKQSISIKSTLPPLRFFGEDMPTSWIGNFFMSEFFLDGEVWPNVESYFQASKFPDQESRDMIKQALAPSYAKAIAWQRDNLKRSDWAMVRNKKMLNSVYAKFEQKLFSSQIVKTYRNVRDRGTVPKGSILGGKHQRYRTKQYG